MWFNSFINIYIEPKTKKKLAEFENDLAFQNEFQRLYKMAMNRWTFENLPETCNERVIQQSMLLNGSAVFFDKEDQLLSLPGYPAGGGFNIYGDPLSAWVYSWNGSFNEQVSLYVRGGLESSMLRKGNGQMTPTSSLGVFVRENSMCYPFLRVIIYYAKAIADTLRAIDVCRVNMKTPFIITAQEEVINSVKRFFEDREKNMSYIISSGVFPADKIQLQPITTTNEALTSLMQLCDWYEQRFREICGIDSLAQIDKKGENLIEAEVVANDEVQEINLDASLHYIQQGLDDVNKIFGTNIKVVRKENSHEDIPRDFRFESNDLSRNSESDGSTDNQ